MSERYRPLFKLDSGGMAEVYVAEAESMAGFKKKVAIKRILPSLLKDDRFVRMFLDEARLSLHLTHANIVSVFDIGKSSSTYFIVMEYVEGINLKGILQDLTRKGATFPVHLTVWVLNEVLKGLDYAHNLRDPETGRKIGIVHRDISPPNILVSWNGEVKLTDFGLAKASTQLESTDPGVVKGKFSYLSPEAASGLEVDARADIFALSTIFYEMLAGRHCFRGQSIPEILYKIVHEHPDPIETLRPDLPPAVINTIRWGLCKRRRDRPQPMSELLQVTRGLAPPPQEVLQQTPSTQFPLAQALPMVHVSPFAALHVPAPSQAMVPMHIVSVLPTVVEVHVPTLPATMQA